MFKVTLTKRRKAVVPGFLSAHGRLPSASETQLAGGPPGPAGCGRTVSELRSGPLPSTPPLCVCGSGGPCTLRAASLASFTQAWLVQPRTRPLHRHRGLTRVLRGASVGVGWGWGPGGPDSSSRFPYAHPNPRGWRLLRKRSRIRLAGHPRASRGHPAPASARRMPPSSYARVGALP